MQYETIVSGLFVARPNRFIAHVELDGAVEVCHVKNTGRCRELLLPGVRVHLAKSSNPARKTKYDLVAVEKQRACGPLLINMDSQAPNKVFGEWAQAGEFVRGLELLKAETTYGDSRFDYYWQTATQRGFVEVKGVTLERDGVACFPDAPTQRGVKHMLGLIAARQAGYRAAVCFVIQMQGMASFRPNDVTHPQFGDVLRRAAQAGVEVLAMGCRVTPHSLVLDAPVAVEL